MKHVFAAALICGASPALAIDGCLVGQWEVDAADMAFGMQQQLGNAVRHVSGRMSVVITEAGLVNLSAENLTFSLAIPDVPPVEIQLVGYGIATLTAEDGQTFSAVSTEYNVVGSADVFGQKMEIPVTPANAGWGNTQGLYGCSDIGASFEPNVPGTFPSELIRVR